MKGLLLKDFYMTLKYCKAYILIVAVFILVSFAGDDNLFFIFYPCLLTGMIPATLLAYDERSKWNEYCGTLPYSKAQIVSAKYLIGLFTQIFVLTLSAIAQAVKLYNTGTFVFSSYLVMMTILFIMSCVTSSISLPFMFKRGVERGRIAYFVMIGFVCAGSVAASSIFRTSLQTTISFSSILPLICIAAVAIYALSWYLSIVFYKKREI